MRNFFWSQVPFLRLLTGVIAGILLAIYFDVVPLYVAWVLALTLALVFTIVIFNKKLFSSHRYRWLPGVLIYLFLVCVFYILTLEKVSLNYAQHFSKSISQAEAFTGYICGEPVEKKKTRKTEIEITGVSRDGQWVRCTGKCLAYISRDSLSSKLSYGDVITFTPVPEETIGPPNPSQFDYRKYLWFHQVYHQVYLAPGKWIPMHTQDGSTIKTTALGARKKLLGIYAANGISGQEMAVLSALTLGYTDDIDEETQQAFAAAGAMHVLSVSGLHVGIVVYALSLLLFFLDSSRKNKIIKTVLIIIFIWMYALVTGLSPAVLRASVMFSVIILGEVFLRQTNIFNAIAISAFILLLINPFLIMEVGFQLSYLAVIGIVTIHPWIYRQLYVKNFLLDKIWALTSVSIAAQVATFPLGLLYFQQFPTGFLISNLIIIPASTLIIYGGLLMLLVNPFSSWLASMLAFPVKYLTIILNKTLTGMEHIPHSFVSGISISILQSWLLYFIIVGLCVFFVKRSAIWLSVAMLMAVLFFSVLLYDSIRINRQKSCVVYCINGKSAVQFTHGRDAVLIADHALLTDKSIMQFNINRNVYDCGITNLKQVESELLRDAYIINRGDLFYKNGFILFNGKRFFWANGYNEFHRNQGSKIRLDAVIISGKSVRNLSLLTDNFIFDNIIVDGSVPGWLRQKLMAEAAERKVVCYSVADSGALLLKS